MKKSSAKRILARVGHKRTVYRDRQRYGWKDGLQSSRNILRRALRSNPGSFLIERVPGSRDQLLIEAKVEGPGRADKSVAVQISEGELQRMGLRHLIPDQYHKQGEASQLSVRIITIAVEALLENAPVDALKAIERQIEELEDRGRLNHAEAKALKKMARAYTQLPRKLSKFEDERQAVDAILRIANRSSIIRTLQISDEALDKIIRKVRWHRREVELATPQRDESENERSILVHIPVQAAVAEMVQV